MTTRRTILAAAAGAAGLGVPLIGMAGAESTAAASTAARRAVPDTLATGRFMGSNGRPLRVPETSFPLSHLAIAWTAATPAVRIRYRDGWGAWIQMAPCDRGKDAGAPARHHVLLTAPSAVGYEVGGGSTAVSVTELNTVDGPARAIAAPASAFPVGAEATGPQYLSRAGWGADETLRFAPDGTESWPAEYFPVQTLTVHHTAGANDDPDPAATVRAIYYYDTVTQGWGDLGYHLLIDEAGTIYEGRWSGSDPTPVFGEALGADGRPQMVNGAHVVGYNAGNVGVVLLGDFTSRVPTAAARHSLTAALAALADVTGLDPLGTTDYVNPVNGATHTGSTISGHRDWRPTLCPGDLFYPQLAAVRQDVADLLS